MLRPGAATEEWAERFSSLFLRKAFDAAHRTYLLNPPTLLTNALQPDGTMPTQAVAYAPCWEQIGEALKWLASILGPVSSAAAATREAMRRQALAQGTGVLISRYQAGLASDGSPPGWVIPLDLAKLEEAFKGALDLRASLEQQVVKLAAQYSSAEQVLTARDVLRESLQAAEKSHPDRALALRAQVSDMHALWRSAAEAYEAAAKNFREELKHFKRQVAGAFSCTAGFTSEVLGAVTNGAAMCLFVPTIPMAALQVAGSAGSIAASVERARTLLTGNNGEEVSKAGLIGDIEVLENDANLSDAARTLIDESTQEPSDYARRLIGRLDQLDAQVSNLTGALGKDATASATLAISRLKSALLDKGASEIGLTQSVLAFASERDRVELIARQKADLEERSAGQEAAPDWLEAAVATSELYHAQVLRVMELMVQLRAKVEFLAPGTQDMHKLAAEARSLWLMDGRDPVAASEAAMRKLFEDLRGRILEHATLQPGALQAVPSDEHKRGILAVKITDATPKGAALLAEFRRIGKIKLRLVDRARDASDEDALPLGNAGLYYGLRVTAVQARVIGAATSHSQGDLGKKAPLTVGVFSGWQSSLRDSRGNLHTFRHPGRKTSTTHKISTRAEDDDDSDLGDGFRGYLRDSLLDAIGVLGTWTIYVPDADGEDDSNAGLTLSGVSALLLHFHCVAYPK